VLLSMVRRRTALLELSAPPSAIAVIR